MADQIVQVRFKNGQVKGLSAQVANNKSYQKSYGFSVLEEGEQVIEPVEPQKKIEAVKQESPVVPETENENELTAQVETESLPQEEVKPKNKGGRPKKSTTKTT